MLAFLDVQVPRVSASIQWNSSSAGNRERQAGQGGAARTGEQHQEDDQGGEAEGEEEAPEPGDDEPPR